MVFAVAQRGLIHVQRGVSLVIFPCVLLWSAIRTIAEKDIACIQVPILNMYVCVLYGSLGFATYLLRAICWGYIACASFAFVSRGYCQRVVWYLDKYDTITNFLWCLSFCMILLLVETLTLQYAPTLLGLPTQRQPLSLLPAYKWSTSSIHDLFWRHGVWLLFGLLNSWAKHISWIRRIHLKYEYIVRWPRKTICLALFLVTGFLFVVVQQTRGLLLFFLQKQPPKTTKKIPTTTNSMIPTASFLYLMIPPIFVLVVYGYKRYWLDERKYAFHLHHSTLFPFVALYCLPRVHCLSSCMFWFSVGMTIEGLAKYDRPSLCAPRRLGEKNASNVNHPKNLRQQSNTHDQFYFFCQAHTTLCKFFPSNAMEDVCTSKSITLT